MSRECGTVSKLLAPFLEGHVLNREGEQVTAHVRSCSACAAELKDLKEVRDLLRQHGKVSPPDGWAERFAARLAARRETHPVPIVNRAWIRLAAVVLLAFGIGVAAGLLLGKNARQDSGAIANLQREVDALYHQVATLKSTMERAETGGGTPSRPKLADLRRRFREQLEGRGLPESITTSIDGYFTDDDLLRLFWQRLSQDRPSRFH